MTIGALFGNHVGACGSIEKINSWIEGGIAEDKMWQSLRNGFNRFSGFGTTLIKWGIVAHCTLEYIGDFVIVRHSFFEFQKFMCLFCSPRNVNRLYIIFFSVADLAWNLT